MRLEASEPAETDKHSSWGHRAEPRERGIQGGEAARAQDLRRVLHSLDARSGKALHSEAT